MALLLDQQSTLFPDPPIAFTSFSDVVERLLPYHIWQIHDEELEYNNGKAQETKGTFWSSQNQLLGIGKVL